MIAKTVSAGTAAAILYSQLGPVRNNWSDFLADCIRLKTSVYGLRLMPCAKLHDGRTWRPRYSLADITDFCKKVLAKSGCKYPTTPISLDINPHKGWRENQFGPDGTPVAKLAARTAATATSLHHI